jgi:trimethylamine--corrinoid protein Co-methyltransferase
MDTNGQAMDAIAEVGPGGHYLGCAHTHSNFKTAFWRTDLLDYRPFETWDEEGARDTMELARQRVQKQIESYQQPPLDPEIEGRLRAYVAEKKASMPDAFG